MTGDGECQLELIVESMNAMLGSGLSLALERERSGAEPPPDGRRSEGYDGASAVLTLAAGSHPSRRASRRLRLTPGHRPLLLTLSSCLAECAMDLGLGASVCRIRTTETP